MKKKEQQLESIGVARLHLRKAFRSTRAKVGLVIVAAFILAALLAPVLAPNDPLLVNIVMKLKGPSAAYPLGNDQLGRCELSRLIWGSRYSLLYSGMVLGITILIGVPIGLIAGYVGGKTDSFLMRVIDVFMAVPSFVVALAIAGTLGASGRNLVFSMSLVFWAEYARLTRALTLQVKGQNYMMALRAGGCGNVRILLRHVLRNIAPSIIVMATLEIGRLILHIASFSFLGLGVQAPAPEWGIMLSGSREYLQTHPELMMIPGVAIFIVVLAFNLLGEGIQDGLSAD